MTDAAETLNARWAEILVEELVRNGADFFCITPGSRSTPLTVAAARNPGARCVVHYDERGAAFFALGYARAAEKPAVVICTSGTAAANYYPAVIEAAQARVPMVMLTADRPPELLDAGANQTIRQPDMFGPYVRWRFDLPCPNSAISPAFVLTTVDQAVRRAMGPEAGPVHLNCPYREPLVPPETAISRTDLSDLDEWHAGNRPYTQYAPVSRDVCGETAELLQHAVKQARRPVLAVGTLGRAADREAISALAAGLGCPVFPDVASGLRLGDVAPTVISHFDLLLSSPEFARQCVADLVIHIGGPMVSKPFLRWLEHTKPRDYVRIVDHPCRDDPAHLSTLRIEADTGHACAALATCRFDAVETVWLDELRHAQTRAASALAEHFAVSQDFTEPAVARLTAAMLEPADMLFLGNSMPVRDMDRYGPVTEKGPAVFANRGASGIDGSIATAAGTGLGSGRPVTALLGDLAALHDLNSLALVRNVPVPVILVVINNDGGGIFHFLPVATHNDVFERYFGAPHGLNFECAAAMFGVAYCRPKTLDEFHVAYSAARARPGATIIEVRTSRNDGVRVRGELDARTLEAVRG